jgi:uncharacterized repeat protein (TIGR03803 family)
MIRQLKCTHTAIALSLVVAGLGSASQPCWAADPYQGLYSFNKADGSFPVGQLLQVGTELWGTATAGGGNGVNGVLFSINPDGSNYQVRHAFTGMDGDGSAPSQGVVAVGSKLYGMTSGTIDSSLVPATIYSLNADGTDYQTLHTFSDLATLQSTSLLSVGDRLFGVEAFTFGGNQRAFSMSLDGSDFQYLHTFDVDVEGKFTNGRLLEVGSVLYGTTSSFGPSKSGTVFSMNLDGSDFQVLHAFVDAPGGNGPWAGLTLIDSVLYGTTHGGIGTGGSVFSINLDGTNFQTLHTFNTSDAVGPIGELIVSNSVLYGVTLGVVAGPSSEGSVYSLNLDGSNFQILTKFDVPSDPRYPASGLTMIGSKLFGTTAGLEASSTSPDRYGTVFAIAVPEPSAFLLGLTGAALLAAGRFVRRKR